MDGRGHPETDERTSWEGHSIGRWEGETLVVDTTQFRDHPEGNGRGVPSGALKHMIERYSLSEDGRRVVIDVFLEDPEFLAEPFKRPYRDGVFAGTGIAALRLRSRAVKAGRVRIARCPGRGSHDPRVDEMKFAGIFA